MQSRVASLAEPDSYTKTGRESGDARIELVLYNSPGISEGDN